LISLQAVVIEGKDVSAKQPRKVGGAKGAVLRFLEAAVEGGEDNFRREVRPFGYCSAIINSGATVKGVK